jgi:hypothetical protein
MKNTRSFEEHSGPHRRLLGTEDCATRPTLDQIAQRVAPPEHLYQELKVWNIEVVLGTAACSGVM